MKHSFLIWALATTILILMPIACAAQAVELSSHSPYTITTFNFDISGDQLGITNSPQPHSLLLITGFNSAVLENELRPSAMAPGILDDFSSTKSFVLSGKYDATSRFAITGAFGITQNLSNPLDQEYSEESSWEANLGIVYKFFDNVSYGLNFGYLEPGDVFSDQATFSEGESVLMISNQLSLSF